VNYSKNTSGLGITSSESGMLESQELQQLQLTGSSNASNPGSATGRGNPGGKERMFNSDFLAHGEIKDSMFEVFCHLIKKKFFLVEVLVNFDFRIDFEDVGERVGRWVCRVRLVPLGQALTD
jgi:hypothetical protein